MTLTLDRVEIESVGSDPVVLARALLAQLPDLDGRVPIDEIALALDILSIEVKPLSSIEACLQCDTLRDKGQIVVSSGSNLQRRRYSIGHELGHFLNERHRPVTPGGFACTRQDMVAPQGNARHIQQEAEANTFAIEVLTPRRLLQRHILPGAELEHALAIAARFDISREAATRRYVALHRERLAAVFSHNGRIRYVDKPEGFPHLSTWNGDRLPASHANRVSKQLTDMDEADPADWLARPGDCEVFVQTLHQQEGHAITLLVAEPSDDPDEAH